MTEVLRVTPTPDGFVRVVEDSLLADIKAAAKALGYEVSVVNQRVFPAFQIRNGFTPIEIKESPKSPSA